MNLSEGAGVRQVRVLIAAEDEKTCSQLNDVSVMFYILF